MINVQLHYFQFQFYQHMVHSWLLPISAFFDCQLLWAHICFTAEMLLWHEISFLKLPYFYFLNLFYTAELFYIKVSYKYLHTHFYNKDVLERISVIFVSNRLNSGEQHDDIKYISKSINCHIFQSILIFSQYSKS